MSNKNYWLMQAYGIKDILNEAKFALLSFLSYNQNNNVKIIIYTDDIDYFADYTDFVTFKQIDSEFIKKCKGEIDFVHRVKIKIIEDFWMNHSNANLLYTDTDIVFLNSIDLIFDHIENNDFIFHCLEGKISNRSNLTFKRLDKFLNKLPNELNYIFQNSNVSDLNMYNAGVLGMNSNELIPKALDFTDKMYPFYQRHIVEQFAFSYFAQISSKNIITTESYIYHYWFFKDFRNNLKIFFELNSKKTLAEQLVLHSQILPQNIKITKKKPFFRFIDKIKRFFKKIAK